MSSHLTDRQLEKIYGKRGSGTALFEPWELGYRCPRGHRGSHITWSEFNHHIWCYKCQLDYLSNTCPIQRPSWQGKEDFEKTIARLPFKPRVIRGMDRTIEELDKLEAKWRQQSEVSRQ